MPKPAVLEGWAAQVPESFRFALKASRRITHLKRLRDVGDETAYFLSSAAALGPRLGALLFQLPPNLKLDLERLDAFLALLPEGTRAAFEFRHPSWNDAAVHERLRARDFAWVVADVDDAPPPAMVSDRRLELPAPAPRRLRRRGARDVASRIAATARRGLRLLQARGRGCGAAPRCGPVGAERRAADAAARPRRARSEQAG